MGRESCLGCQSRRRGLEVLIVSGIHMTLALGLQVDTAVRCLCKNYVTPECEQCVENRS